jgi:protein-S-isoprenylcysteine O-methyltransferase Ste14
VLSTLRTLGWLACVIYSTIPLFWLTIHPFAHRWRQNSRSPYRMLGPIWIAAWIVLGTATSPWRELLLYSSGWSWIAAALLFAAGIFLYIRSGAHFSWSQLAGLPEISSGNHSQRLVMTGIRARVRHPIYLAHLCELLAWSVGTGLVVCWMLTAFAIVTGAVMIRMEDAELVERFGEEFMAYRLSVPAILPRIVA